uniref:C2H2-type domain-containing protein n=1 Tax=Steinernema glaseri TaxID=37863 RepID=A0A1I7YAH9_9BILA
MCLALLSNSAHKEAVLAVLLGAWIAFQVFGDLSEGSFPSGDNTDYGLLRQFRVGNRLGRHLQRRGYGSHTSGKLKAMMDWIGAPWIPENMVQVTKLDLLRKALKPLRLRTGPSPNSCKRGRSASSPSASLTFSFQCTLCQKRIKEYCASLRRHNSEKGGQDQSSSDGMRDELFPTGKALVQEIQEIRRHGGVLSSNTSS